MNPTPVIPKLNNKLISSSVNLKKKMENTWATNLNLDKLSNWVESNSLSAKLALMVKLALPPAKIKPEFTPAEMLWNTTPLKKNPLKAQKTAMKSLNAKSVSNKLKIMKTFCLTLVFVWVHAEPFIWIALLNGFTSKSKKKLLAEPNITTFRSSNAKFVKLNFPWLLTSMGHINSFFQLKNPMETTLFCKELAIKKKVWLWSKIFQTKESS